MPLGRVASNWGHLSTESAWASIYGKNEPTYNQAVVGGMARVLVVDDEEYIVDLLSLLLEDDGHLPLRAFNGKEALEVVTTDNPQMVIADVMMPLMDGVELTRTLKSNPKTAGITVILMSALGAMGTDVPADDFIAKPFDLELVRHVVETHLQETGNSQEC